MAKIAHQVVAGDYMERTVLAVFTERPDADRFVVKWNAKKNSLGPAEIEEVTVYEAGELPDTTKPHWTW